MLASKIEPSKFNGRRHKYVAFIFNVKKINLAELLTYLKRKYNNRPDIIIEPKYDGLYIQVSKKSKEIKIYSDQGNNLTKRINSQILEALLKLPCDTLVAEGELETYLNNKHQPRGVTIGLIHKKVKEPHNYHEVLTLFDCLYLNGEDISKLSTLDRLKKLDTLKLPSSLTPTKIFLNRVPYIRGTTWGEITRAVLKFCRIKHFEGAILKDTKQTARNLSFIKFKRYIEFALQVIKKIPTKTPGVFNYDLAALNEKGELELIARSHNSKLNLSPGTRVAVAAYNVSLFLDENGKRIRVRLYSSTIQNETRAPVNTIQTILQTAKEFNVLEVHKIT